MDSSYVCMYVPTPKKKLPVLLYRRTIFGGTTGTTGIIQESVNSEQESVGADLGGEDFFRAWVFNGEGMRLLITDAHR